MMAKHRHGNGLRNSMNRSTWLRARDHDDEGTVTAEFAVVMPAVVIVATLLLTMARVSVVSMECQEAAANVARALVLNGDDADIESIAQSSASTDVQLTVATLQDRVTVTTQCAVIPDPLHVLPATVTASATHVKQ